MKSLLVALHLQSGKDAVGPYAASLAWTLGAEATGLACVMNIAPVPLFAGGLPADISARATADLAATAASAEARFMAAAKRQGCLASTRRLAGPSGTVQAEFARIARYFDLTLLQQPQPDVWDGTELLLESALFHAGRPLLIVPFIQSSPARLDRVIFAWDGSAAAARALADAMGLLQHAKHVEIATVDRGQPAAVDPPGFDLCASLARHSIAADRKRLPSGLDVASTLLSYAADTGADLLVMGAYRHSRFREQFLSGATDRILKTMTIPVLMSH
jgi:nucleotide-binding universal stress UspA family protein